MKAQLTETESLNISVTALAAEIYACGQYLKRNFTAEELQDGPDGFTGTDCRLRVHNGNWQLLTGSSDYDQDHRGYWSCSSIGRACTRQESIELARELINGLE